MKGILYHTLRGKPGWSWLHENPIDIGRVNGVVWRKRLFRVFDRDHPYTIEITYKKKGEEPVMLVGWTGSGCAVVPSHKTVNEQTITCRYKSAQDVITEVEDINKSVRILKAYTTREMKKHQRSILDKE